MGNIDFECRDCHAVGRRPSGIVECPSCGSALIHIITDPDAPKKKPSLLEMEFGG